jgi:hypothetical protein
MKLGKETKVTYHKFDVDFENKEYKMLKNYALQEIVKDDEALVNYAVNKILTKAVQDKVKVK